MLPVVYAFLRSNARFVVLPIAVVIGTVGYLIETSVSSKYTPYTPSIEQTRRERQTSGALTENRNQGYENALEKNLSESLRGH